MSRTNDLEDRTPPRSRRPLVIVAILAVLAVAAVAVIYVTFFTDDAPERLALTDQPTPDHPSPVTPAPGGGVARPPPSPRRPRLSRSSPARGGRRAGSTPATASGRSWPTLPAKSDAVGRSPARDRHGEGRAGRGTLTATDANFEVDLTKLASDDSRRDNRIRTDGLQTNQFPKATFVSTKPIPLPAETASGQAVKATAEGDLTLHGVTKRVTIPLDVRVAGGKGELVGSLAFPMSDFNITPPSIGGFVTVDPDATLEFKLVLEKA